MAHRLQLYGDVCPNCGTIKDSVIENTNISSRIGNRNYPTNVGLVKRFHKCKECGTKFNTIAIREDCLEQLFLLLGGILQSHESTREKIENLLIIADD